MPLCIRVMMGVDVICNNLG